MSGGGGESSRTTTTQPWGPSQQYLSQGLQRLGPAYSQAASYPYPTSGAVLTPMASGELGRYISGQYMRGNPYLEAMIGRTTADVNSQFAGAGRYGSGAHQNALANAIGGLRYQDYAAQQAYQMQAMGLAPQFDLAPYTLYSSQVAAPYENLRNYLGLAGAVGSQGNMQTSPIYRNQTASALGGALSGAAAGAMYGSAIPGIGTGVGALIGGVGGLAMGSM